MECLKRESVLGVLARFGGAGLFLPLLDGLVAIEVRDRGRCGIDVEVKK